jgi:hypothetical protein
MKTGGPAFPTDVAYREDGEWHKDPGMTLRDWFAGMAMSGLYGSSRSPVNKDGIPDSSPDNVARIAYAVADSMIYEREEAVK